MAFNKELAGTILAITAAVISGISIPANKLFIVDIDPVIFTAIRCIIIGIIFLAISAFRFNFSIKKFKQISWKYMATIALVGGSFAFLLFFTGLKLTTSGRAAFLQKTMPLFIAIFALVFLKEKLTKKYTIAFAAMILGIIAIYVSSITPSELWSNPSLGDVLILGATLLWAIEITISKKAMIKGADNFIVSFSRMFFGGIILFGVALLYGKTGMLMSLTSSQITNIAMSTAILFGYVLFWYASIKLINISKASSFLLLSPVITLIIGITFLGEPVPLMQLLGSAAILMGAYLMLGTRSENNCI